MTTTTYDAGDLCVYCGRDTSFGSGLFVNRLAAATDTATADWLDEGTRASFTTIHGYACPECMTRECDRCDDPIQLDEDYIASDDARVHYDCLTPAEKAHVDAHGDEDWDTFTLPDTEALDAAILALATLQAPEATTDEQYDYLDTHHTQIINTLTALRARLGQ
jgi:hypothetical protein